MRIPALFLLVGLLLLSPAAFAAPIFANEYNAVSAANFLGGAASSASFEFGGNYIVFVLRDGKPTPVMVRTGLTDLDYSEVVTGLGPNDSVLVLPSASLVQQQEEFRNRMSNMTGGGAVPGMTSGGGRRP